MCQDVKQFYHNFKCYHYQSGSTCPFRESPRGRAGCLALFCISLFSQCWQNRILLHHRQLPAPMFVCGFGRWGRRGVLGALHMFAITLLVLLRVCRSGEADFHYATGKNAPPQSSHSQPHRNWHKMQRTPPPFPYSTHGEEAGRVLAHPHKSRTCR